MLNEIRNNRIDGLNGDLNCLSNQLNKRHRYVESGYNLDMWTAVTCTMNMRRLPIGTFIALSPPNTRVPEPNLQTTFLHLYERTTASFTLIPRTLNPTFFVTDQLSGCDVFVAAASGRTYASSSVVVIHTNLCNDLTSDRSHQAAIAVLSTDILRQVPYQIRYRLASKYQRRVIEPQRYHYYIDYYDGPELPDIFYGYTYGGSTPSRREPWVFCHKRLFKSTTSPQCHLDPDF